MLKIDLHTHSVASPDGGINAVQYRQALESGLLDCIAITDHNRIDFALEMQRTLGERIIVGEEIMTLDGEIIGLFLNNAVKSDLPAKETVQEIKRQGGLVYVPHPFETVRKGIEPSTLEDLADQVDIIEVCNGRAFLQNRSQQTVVWTRLNRKISAASSDAHGQRGLGETYTLVSKLPDRNNLLDLLSVGALITGQPGLRSLLYPKYHRLRKKIRSIK